MMKLVQGVLVLFLFVAAMSVAWFYLAKVPFLSASFFPAPTSVDQVPQSIVKAYRATQDPWDFSTGASLQFCTNGFSAVYKFGSTLGSGKQGQIFDTTGALLLQEYRGEIPEDDKVPRQVVWYKLFGNCTDLAPLFKQQ